MRRLCQRPGRSAGAGRVGRAIVGCFFLVLAVTVTQPAAVWPAVARDTAAPSTVASDTVLAWGENASGQLGDGTATDSSTPVTVDLPAGTTVTAVAGGTHSLALTSAGTVLAWGLNTDGQLGDGTTTDRSTPVTVSLSFGTTVTAIAGGTLHSLALVAPPPASATALQVNPANPTADQEITLTATVTCNVDTPTGTITFRTNNTTLATTPLNNATATHTTALPTGGHTLTAHYTSTNTCPNSQSTPVSRTINPPPDEPDLPITGPNITTTLTAAALLTLTGVTFIHLTRRRRLV